MVELTRFRDNKTGKIGFKNQVGTLIVPCVYTDTAFAWSEGFIYVQRPGWKGFLNEDGDEVVCLNDYYLSEHEHPCFQNGVCRVSKEISKGNIVRGFIDNKGKEICPIEFSDCRLISQEIIIASKGKRKEMHHVGGKTVDLSAFYSIGTIIAPKLLTVSVEGKYGLEKWGCVDLDGNIVIPTVYDQILGSDGTRITVKLSDKYGIIDTRNCNITGFLYEEARVFKQGRCAVCINSKWGFIDTEGEFCIPASYKTVRDFDASITGVQIGNDEWCLIERNGDLALNVKYKEIGNFQEGLCAVKTFKGWGFINETGAVCIPCQFAEVEAFVNGQCKVKRPGLVTGKDSPWGIIDKKGNFTQNWDNNNLKNISDKVGEVFTFLGKIVSVFG